MHFPHLKHLSVDVMWYKDICKFSFFVSKFTRISDAWQTLDYVVMNAHVSAYAKNDSKTPQKMII